jgi:hypothetical protein
MRLDTTLAFDGPPSAAAYMLGAALPPRRSPQTGGVRFLPLRVRWTGFTTGSRDRLAIQRKTGLADDARLDLVLPRFTGFRALMVLLTHPTFPLPIWRALQIRNGLRLLREADGEEPGLEAWVAGQRVLDKAWRSTSVPRSGQVVNLSGRASARSITAGASLEWATPPSLRADHSRRMARSWQPGRWRGGLA